MKEFRAHSLICKISLLWRMSICLVSGCRMETQILSILTGNLLKVNSKCVFGQLEPDGPTYPRILDMLLQNPSPGVLSINDFVAVQFNFSALSCIIHDSSVCPRLRISCFRTCFSGKGRFVVCEVIFIDDKRHPEVLLYEVTFTIYLCLCK